MEIINDTNAQISLWEPDARAGISKKIEKALGERGCESDRAIPLQEETADSQMTCLMVRVSLL